MALVPAMHCDAMVTGFGHDDDDDNDDKLTLQSHRGGPRDVDPHFRGLAPTVRIHQY